MTSTKRCNVKGTPLLYKVLLPFVLILGILGVGTTLIFALVITKALTKTADERLAAIQEVAFREIKRQEILLATYAGILDHTLNEVPGKEALALPDRVQKLLRGSGITAEVYSAGMLETADNPALRDLLDQATRSGRQQFRFSTGLGETPTLAVATPIHSQGGNRRFLLLQAPMGQVFLSKLSAPFNARAFLFANNGEVLTGSEHDQPPPVLTPEELEQVLTGQRVFKSGSAPLPRRHLFSAVPMGTADVILLSLDLPMTDLQALVKTVAAFSVAAMTMALLLGGYVYHRLTRRITAQTLELQAAARAVSEGNLDYRITNTATDELGEVAEAFNGMLGQLEVACHDKLDQERQLTRAQEELKYQQIFEHKNREIERTHREMKAHLRELSALFQLNQAISSTLDLNLLFDRILQVLKEVIHCEEMVLLLYNPGAAELEVRKSVGIDAETLKGVSFRLDEGVTGQAARNQELVHIHDVATDTRILNYKGRNLMRGSMVAAPLVVKTRLMGILNLHKETAAGFSDAEIKLIQTVVNQAAVAIENAQLYEKTKTLSNTDDVTALANRRYFQEILTREVTQARRYGSCFSIVMADIDHFKQFNDTHGHLRGDSVLRKVAALFLQNTRGIDLVARFGGEEFVVLLPKTNKEGARAAAEKLRQCVAAEAVTGAERSQPGGRLTLSLGVAEFPTDSKDIYELIDLADRALYLAKNGGRNRTVAWSDKNPPPPDVVVPPPPQPA